MGRENKKEAVAAFHRQQILRAAGDLFTDKGFKQTTIDDISKESGYSRRTIYVYYESKEDILHHIIENGLISLKTDIKNILEREGGGTLKEGAKNRDTGKTPGAEEDFVLRYMEICRAMKNYRKEYPHSVENVNSAEAAKFDNDGLSDTIKSILALGEKINELLSGFIDSAKKNGIVRKDVVPVLTVQILWSSISALLNLADTKESYLSKRFAMSEDEFLDYGFKQLINSVLEVRI